jgi:hypothetical protein
MSTNFFRANVDLSHELQGADCFERMKPKYLALLPADLRPVNLDVHDTCTIILGTLPKVREYRERAARLTEFDISSFDDLTDGCFALEHTHSNYQIALRPNDGLDDLNAEAEQTHDRFLADLEGLSVNGCIDSGSLQGVTGVRGYVRTAADLRRMVEAYRKHWNQLQGKTCRTQDELARAEAVANRMIRLTGERDHSEKRAREWSELRTRAFSLLLRHYENVRRAIAFFRWFEDDLEKIAPSLWTGRGKRKKVPARAPNQPAVPPAAPIGPNGPFVPQADAAGPNDPFGLQAQPSAGNPNVEPGMPGGSPFIH